MENRSWGIESGWSCSGGNSSTKDTCIGYCEDRVDATVKDGDAIVLQDIYKNNNKASLLLGIFKYPENQQFLLISKLENNLREEV